MDSTLSGIDINLSLIQPEEIDAAQLLELHISDLDGHENDFRVALDLFQTANAWSSAAYERSRSGRNIPSEDPHWADIFRFGAWARIAAEHAAINVANFRDRLHAIRLGAQHSQSLSKCVRVEDLAKISNDFDKALPYTKSVRDAFAHKTDKMFNLAKLNKNSVDSRSYAASCISGDKLYYSVDGSFVTLEISPSTADTLGDLKQRVYLAFEAVSVPRV